MMKNNKNLYNVLFIILAAIVLRLPTFLFSYVNIDETDYTLAARVILNGGIPYKDFLIYQPPMIYYIYALGFWLSGGTNLWAVHIITILFAAATAVTLYCITLKLTEKTSAALVSGLAYAFYSVLFLPMDMLAANCEILMMLPMTLGALALIAAEKRGNFLVYLFAGIFFGIGIMAKYQGGVVWGAAIVYVLIAKPALERAFSFKKTVLPFLFITAGFFLPTLIFSLYLIKFEAAKEALEAFSYIVLYAKGPAQSDLLYVFLKFVTRSIIFGLSSLPMWIASFWVICRALFCHHESTKGGQSNSVDTAGLLRRSTPRNDIVFFVMLWFLFSIAPIVMGGRIYFHYYFIIMPPAAILFGVWWHMRSALTKKWVKVLMLVWLIICTAGWEGYAVFRGFQPPKTKETWADTAEYLKEIAKPGDTLFIWGCAYQLYFVSGMGPANRFTSADYLTGRSPMTAGLEFDPKKESPSPFEKLYYDFKDRPGVIIYDTSRNIFPPAWDYFKEDMAKELPKYIVDTSPSNYRRYGRYPLKDFPYLEDIIKKNYEMIQSIDGYDIYKIK